MIDIIAKLAQLRLGHVTPDMPRCTEILQAELPFQEFLYQSGDRHNGWTVPQSWHVTKATIHDANGELLYDGLQHPLGVCMYSDSFIAGIGGELLKEHLYYSSQYDDALIYHCDWPYKPHTRSWGFSVPKNLYDRIGDREAFHVELRTVHESGHMRSLVSSAVGTGGGDFVFAAHNCHPSLCNDDLSGIAVGIEVMRRLPKGHRNTYRLVIAPEHYGTVMLLADARAAYLRNADGGLFLEAFGTNGPLALQRSFTGVALIDRAVRNVLSDGNQNNMMDGKLLYRPEYVATFQEAQPYGPWYEMPFRHVAGNDETCFEAPGIEVPFASLTRYPFKEYHTSNDNVALMDAAKLEEAVRVVLAIVDVLEHDCVMSRTCPDGLVCLSNPQFDLYQPTWDPSMKDRSSKAALPHKTITMNRLMDAFPRYLDGTTTCLQIAEKFQLPFRAVRDYIAKWEAKGLLKTSPAPIDNTKQKEIPPW
jgi:aminopeptidase-like protein